MAQSQIVDPASWIAVKTVGLELRSTGSQQEAAGMLQTLKQAWSFFAQLGMRDTTPDRPLRIYAFQSRAEYATVRLSRGTFGHCIRGHHSDYIVLEDIQPQHQQAAIHELAHVAFSRAGYHLPVWLNEGLADVYSTFSVTEGHATIGSVLAARAKALNHESWLDLASVIYLTNEQRLFQEGSKVAIFYGESWALTHMLMFSPRYAPAFPIFLRAVSDGQPVIEALAKIYAKTSVELAADLHWYWSEGTFLPRSPNLLPVAKEEPATVPLSPFQSSLALAELLSAAPATRLKAEHLLLLLKEQNPGDPDVQEQLAYVSSANVQTAEERAAMVPPSQN